ncbi:ribonuclease M5 [Aquibacillus sp. 3ASR75-11]|uniref:Ribonuclease M5 n=1 Tax=Terrihalobacillus insolitus TaxID=2950438 RepID=A0A9X4AN50_9BACI|nr:ribonuclease M5 [Terrihalobacillus insolitus]MDC3414877.1 ribonuclease M5 [Terrihalobacillus insolitus]MDC3426026.1 ribonuclease M5 [Terrihalobacillus insolitus]
MKIKEVIVVEGKDDTAKIRQAVDADTIETNGSAIDHDIIQRIKHAKQKRGVIIFTDPDYPGERIRHIVSNNVQGCKHAFLTREETRAKHNKGLGIEHASVEAIRRALSLVYEVGAEFDNGITREDLLQYGLLGGPQAKSRRERLGKRLNIGYTNGKQLLKRLSMFELSKKDFVAAMEQIIQEEYDE